MSSFTQNLQNQVLITLLVIASFFLQFELISPFETEVFPHTDDHFSSLLFLPHGLKILFVFIFGFVALPAIFMARLFAGIFLLDAQPYDAFVGTVFGCVAIFAPVAFLNVAFKKKWYEGINFNENYTINTFHIFIILVLLSTFTNVVLHSAYYHVEATIMMPFRYFVGDILGSTLVFFLLMFFRKYIFKHFLSKAND